MYQVLPQYEVLDYVFDYVLRSTVILWYYYSLSLQYLASTRYAKLHPVVLCTANTQQYMATVGNGVCTYLGTYSVGSLCRAVLCMYIHYHLGRYVMR
jgi:hypothetical protein